MGGRVLIIEDQDEFREMLRITLDFKGYDVVTAANGREGRQIVEGGNNFDLVTSDIEMPVMNGIEFVKWYRGEHGSQKPVIVLSAAESDMRREALAAGASQVIEKPFEPIRLIEEIEKLLKP